MNREDHNQMRREIAYKFHTGTTMAQLYEDYGKELVKKINRLKDENIVPYEKFIHKYINNERIVDNSIPSERKAKLQLSIVNAFKEEISRLPHLRFKIIQMNNYQQMSPRQIGNKLKIPHRAVYEFIVENDI